MLNTPIVVIFTTIGLPYKDLKMKNIILIIFVLILPLGIITAQDYFLKGFDIGVPASNRGWDLQADETGYTITTGSLCYGSEPCFAIIRTDTAGDLLWRKNYNFYPNLLDVGARNNIVLASDGNLLIAGNFQDFSTEEKTIWLMKLTTEGDSLWRQDYQVQGNLTAIFMLEKTNGNILLTTTGYVERANSSGNDVVISLIETDFNGNLIWSRDYKEPFQDRNAGRIHELTDGDLLMGYASRGFGFSDVLMTFSKFTPEGETIWNQEYHKSDGLVQSQVLLDGRYWIGGVGAEIVGGEPPVKIFSTITDTSGMIVSSTTIYEGDVWSEIFNTRLADDGNLIIHGDQWREEADTWVPWLFKMTPEGEILWERFFGHEDNPAGAPFFMEDIQLTPSGDIAASLTYVQPGPENWLERSKVGLLILDNEGCFNGNCDTFQSLITDTEEFDLPKQERIIQLIENPVQDQLNIKWDRPLNGEFRLVTLDSRICKTAVITTNDRTIQIPVSDLDNGFYVLFLLSDGKVVDHKKVLVQR